MNLMLVFAIQESLSIAIEKNLPKNPTNKKNIIGKIKKIEKNKAAAFNIINIKPFLNTLFRIYIFYVITL